MNPVTHFFTGWLVAEAGGLDKKRERAAVTVAAIVPDIDGLGIIAEKLTADSDQPMLWWTEYHHVIGHNLGFGLLAAACVFGVTRRKTVAGLALLAFHVHLLCDIAGARGPEGFQWPIPYLLPFSDALQLVWSGQWALNAWPNIFITAVALCITFFLAWRRGHSPLEMISASADRAFVTTLRNRFGEPE